MGSAGCVVHVVVGGCNVVAILAMADVVCLVCRIVECMSWTCMVYV